jgi:hypothetical protein
MDGYSSARGTSEPPSQFRVAKLRTGAALTLSNGASVRGYFFVSGGSKTHAGPERIKDVLNGEVGFFPFEASGLTGSSTVLYNREHIVMVELADGEEARSEPGYDVAVRRIVTVQFSTGARVRGSVRVYRPQGSDRLSDFARSGETFRYLEAQTATYIINIRHVLELAEDEAAS